MTIARLEQIAASCPDPDGRRFLVGALRKIRAGLPADQAFDLRGPGAIRERNRLLRLAAALLPGSPTEQAREIEAISRRLGQERPRTEAERLVAQAAQCARMLKWRQLIEVIAISPIEIATDNSDTWFISQQRGDGDGR